MTLESWMQFLNSTLAAAAPIALAALGAVFAFRAGIYFLGLEGLMLIGAFSAVGVTVSTQSVGLGLVAAVVASIVGAALFWLVVVVFGADQIVAGLGLSILGLGLTSYGLTALFQSPGSLYVENGLWRPLTGDVQGVAVLFRDLSVLVWATPVIVLLCWVLTTRTHFGLKVTTVGEYPFAARAAGVSPARVRLQALVLCGVLCGLAGAELSLGQLRAFTENITQGSGFIAFSAAIFGSAMPIGTAISSLFFGLANALGIQTQLETEGLNIPRELILAVPYLLTIAAVWYASARRKGRAGLVGFGELRDG